MAKLLRKYTKKSKYGFCSGVYQTLELIKLRPESIQSIYLRADAERNAGVQKIKEFCARNRIAYHINNKAIVHATGQENIQALALFEKYDSPLDTKINHLLLVNPSGAGNVGTILRTMSAFGLHDIAIIKPGVDIFNPEVVRSSMGTIFNSRYEYFESIEEYRQKHAHYLYFIGSSGDTFIQKTAFKEPYTIILTEEEQTYPAVADFEAETIKISLAQENLSLNIAVVAGIVLYQASITK